MKKIDFMRYVKTILFVLALSINSLMPVSAVEVSNFNDFKNAVDETSSITIDLSNNISDVNSNIKLINKNLIINGKGFTYSPINSTSKLLAFDVQSSSILTINNLIISSFNNSDTGWGAGIYNAGILNINNSSFTSNSTHSSVVGGGAIMNDATGIVKITGTNTFSDNSNTTGNGGAIYNRGELTITSKDSDVTTFNGNISSKNGGAIFNGNQITNGTITKVGELTLLGNMHFINTNNTKLEKSGAAIYNDGKITFINENSEKVIFNGNYTNADGAGIYNNNILNMTGTFEFIDNYSHTGKGAGIFNNTNAQSTLEGTFKFKGNSASVGGAIYNNTGASMSITSIETNKLEFIGNYAENDGAGIYNLGTLLLTGNVLFDSNKTKQDYKRGGAIANVNGSINLFGDFDFTNNSSYYGGAIYNNGSMILSGEFLFDGNTANHGAGIYSEGDVYISGQRSGTDSASKVNFENNSANARGGAIYIAGTADNLVRLDVESVDFINNKAGTHGGAIHINDFVNFNIIDSLFKNNSAGENGNLAWGGALSVASNYDSVYAYIENSTFEDNYASNSGGAIASGTSLTVVNSKFFGNQAGKSAGALSYDPRNALGHKSFELIADGDDTVISGNWVADKGTSRDANNAEGLYFGNAIVGDDGQSITGDDGNDSNIYLNAGNSGKIIINDIVNALGDSPDNKNEKNTGTRANVNNPNIQINKDGVTYHKFANDTYDENEDNEDNGSKKANGPKENPAPTDGVVIFNNLVKGANLVLHNGTLAFGKENSYDGYITPTKYFSDGAKITLKGGTLDISNGKIESGDTFAPDSITVIGNANLKLDLNFTTGEIDYINSNIIADTSGNGTLNISSLTFLDNIDTATDLGITKNLQFVKGNELADGKTTLSDTYKNIITKNAGYILSLSTTTQGADTITITKVSTNGGLPVALSLGQNSELSNARGNEYTLTSDEIITDVNGNNSWTKGYVAYIDGNQSAQQTSNKMKGSIFTINGENFGIKTNDNVVGIEVGIENSVAQKLFINDVAKSDNTGFSGFNTAIINNGGEVTIKNSIFNDNNSTSNGGAIYNGQNSILNLISETSKDIIFKNNKANGVANDIYNEGTINISGDGKVIIESGISGTVDATIINTGSFELNNDNSNYLGSYEQTQGTTTINNNSKFFAGETTISGGTLNWFTKEDLDTNATLTITNADFILGDGSNSAKFTVNASTNLDNANSITVNNLGNLIYNVDSTIKDIGGNGLLTVDGAKLTFNDTSSIGNLSFESKNNASVEFSSISDSSNLLSQITSGTNDKLNLIFNNTNINSDINIDGTNIAKIELTNNVEVTGNIINNGKLNNTGNSTIASKISGNGNINNSGNLTITADVSNFTGTFTQTSGITTVNDNAKIFGGEKIINGGELNITSSNAIDYSKIILNNASYTHTTLTEDTNVIDNNVLKFSGNNSTAKFTTSNGITGIYDLKNNITNNTTTGNTVIIENSNINLSGDTDFKGTTQYEFKNSNLNLIEINPNEQTKDYVFDNLKTENTSLSFNVIFKENQNTIDTDTITINNGSQTFDFENIYISGEEFCTIGTYDTTKNVLTGGTFDVDISDVLVEVISTNWKYYVKSNLDKTSIIVEVVGIIDNDPLYEANAMSTTRNFQLDNEIYNLRQSLSETKGPVSADESPANFGIIGNNKDISIISGKIVDANGNETGERGSLFNIANGTKLNLNIQDITIQDAEKNGNGSVIENNSADAKITLSNTNIKDNTTTGNGGAIYNGVQPTDNNEQNLIITNTNFSNNTSTGDGGAIYNNGNAIISNTTFTDNNSTGNGGAIYNSGNLTLANTTFNESSANAKNDIYQANNGKITFVGTNNIHSSISGDATSSITNEGNLNLTADNSQYKGSFTQTNGITTVTDKFFGGNSTIENGRLNWYTDNDLDANATLKVNDGQLVIGKDENAETKLTLSSGSSIAKESEIYIYNKSSLNIDGADVSLNENDAWAGTISLTDGNLTLDNLKGNGLLNATGGELNLNQGNLFIENGSTISEDVSTNINSGTVAINGGNVTINDNDTWSENGTIHLENGNLNITNFNKDNGTLTTNKGTLNLTDSSLTLKNGSSINYDTSMNIDENSTLNIEGGKVGINDNDTWKGTINLGSNNNGGELYYGATTGGTLNAESGKLYLLDNSVLNIKTPSQIKSDVDLSISNKATVNINDGASLELDKNDVWNGKINVNSNGNLKLNNVNNINYGGTLNVTNGGNVEFSNKSNIYITKNSAINGANISLLEGSSLSVSSGVSINANKLVMKDNSLFNAMNNSTSVIRIGDLSIEGDNNFAIDLNLKNKQSDKFVINNLNNSGSINISKVNFIGNIPASKNIDFKVFEVKEGDNVDFAIKTQKLFTPIGSYKLKAMDNGVLRLTLSNFNQQIFRGQASTLASFNNQLLVDDLITNHFIQQGEQFIEDAKTMNKTADISPILAPYQDISEEGSVWMRSYVAFEKLSMTHGLHVGNNTYGSLVGVDMKAIQLKNGWRMIPTAFIGYTGGNQYFKKVDMYQNGVQAGFMSTFIKNQFISSIMAYGGGYINDMSVSGHTDNTGTWFAGVAGKFAYNLNATKNFILQPNVFVSYNAFGKQNWHTGFGEYSMNSGMLNGINVAPGLNFIYKKQTWSVYATVQYMYNINDKISGSINGMDLPSIAMKHGYLQYGFGFTKTYKDRLHSYLQIAFRNGGRTGVGFQVGLRYMFGKKYKK